VHQLFIEFKKAYDSVRRQVLYNILMAFGIHMKMIRLIKMCPNETYSTIRLGKYLSDMFPIRKGLKQGNALSLLLFNVVLVYVIRRVQVNQDGLKFSGTHQLLVYADDVNTCILAGSVRTTKKNTEHLLVGSKEIGLEVNADETKYMVISRDQNAGQSHNIKIGNSSFERVEEFKYLETNLANQNSIQEDTESRLKSGNTCYHPVKNLLSSSLLSKNLKIKKYITLIVPVVSYGCETWSLKLREKSGFRVFENRVLRRIFGPKGDEGTWE